MKTETYYKAKNIDIELMDLKNMLSNVNGCENPMQGVMMFERLQSHLAETERIRVIDFTNIRDSIVTEIEKAIKAKEKQFSEL